MDYIESDSESGATTSANLDEAKPTVLAPGNHYALKRGDIEQVFVGGDEYTKQVVDALVKVGGFYRYQGAAGRVHTDHLGSRFEPMTKEYLRNLIDKHCEVITSNLKTTTHGQTIITKRINSTADHGALVLDRLGRDERVPLLRYICDWPVYLPGWTPAKPGLNAGGYYYSEPIDLNVVSRYDPKRQPLSQERIQRHLDDLLCDFPFEGDADRENFIGLLLTFMARPAIARNIPFFLVSASKARTGKSKLLQEVLGATIFGAPLRMGRQARNPEEEQKVLTAVLASGRPYCCIDNIDGELGGSDLCAVLTSPIIEDRVLGSTNWTTFENTLVFMGTANNTTIMPDMNGRLVTIRLQPLDAEPERRKDFKHPDIYDYALERRAKTLLVLRAMIERWRDAGCPPHPSFAMGSFEKWARDVGGIMWANGYRHWMENWCFVTSDLDQRIADLMDAWRTAATKAPNDALYAWNGASSVATPKQILHFAKDTEYIAEMMVEKKGNDEKSRLVILGKQLAKIRERPVRTPHGEFTIERATTSPATYRLRAYTAKATVAPTAEQAAVVAAARKANAADDDQ